MAQRGGEHLTPSRCLLACRLLPDAPGPSLVLLLRRVCLPEPQGPVHRQRALEVNKVEHNEAEADLNIEEDFDDRSQEEWNDILTSYSSEKEKECPTALREPRTSAPYQNHGGSPPTDSKRESLEGAEDSAWPAVLRTIQSMADALSYHSAKLDVQVEILSSVAIFVSAIDKHFNDLKNIIKRAQEVTNDLTPKCCCCANFAERSHLPNIVEGVMKEMEDRKGAYTITQPQEDPHYS
ncbi:hypothetical protein NDU88_002759 [Pleurodeles waltl]|uniref:Uncharacterized protein n=1 Tax=Pleurodeles waltl TaxID=8319 RepID=A0AAV7T4J5_PLEWA|nr:hypothetical protein NDU88_002759 [Pleurodeles waltl]